VELVAQNNFPGVVQFGIVGIAAVKESISRAEGFGLLQDEAGNAVPCHYATQEAAADFTPRHLFRLKIKAGERRILTFDPTRQTPEADAATDCAAKCLPSFSGDELRFTREGKAWTGPLTIDVCKDDSDTWSHGINSFEAEKLYSFGNSGEWRQADCNSIISRHTAKLQGEDGVARMDVINYHGIPAAEISLKLHWTGKNRIVKMCLKPDFTVASRRDGILAGAVNRRLNGEEYPFRAWTMLTAADGKSLAVVAKEATSLDVQPDGTLRITLLRSPIYAHHCPYLPAETGDFPVTEQGEHEYTFRILLLDSPDEELLEQNANALNRQIFFSESTLGIVPKN
jgi:alpha-mannosidase